MLEQAGVQRPLDLDRARPAVGDLEPGSARDDVRQREPLLLAVGAPATGAAQLSFGYPWPVKPFDRQHPNTVPPTSVVGVLDAAECPPTFGTPRGLVQAIMAGGRGAVFHSREGAEDDGAAARRAVRARVRYVINVLRVFITTNDWMSMYIPPEDRRMFIMHSGLQQRWHEEEGRPQYFKELFGWIVDGGGWRDVAAWLLRRDLSKFDPKAQVVRTAGWSAVAQSWGEPDDAVAAALEALGSPPVLFGTELLTAVFGGEEEIRGALKSPRKIGHRMQRAGYMAVPTPGDNGWRFGKFKSKLAFAKAELLRTMSQPEIFAALKDRGTALGEAKAAGRAAVAGAAAEPGGF